MPLKNMIPGQVFKLFIAFWMARKPDLMDFNEVTSEFETRLVEHLCSVEANLDKLSPNSFD